MPHKLLLLLPLLCGMLQLAWGQLREPSFFQLQFERQNNFSYTTRFDFSHSIQLKKYRLDLQIHHDNIANSLRQDQPFVQMYVSGDIWQYYDLHEHWQAVSWFELDEFVHAGNYRNTAYVGARYHIEDWLAVMPMLGYSWDQRGERLDQGIAPTLQAEAFYEWDDGLKMKLRAFAREKFIKPRHQRDIQFINQWQKSFSESAEIEFGLRGAMNEMNDYKLNSIEKIKVDTIAPMLNLRYQFLPFLEWRSSNQASLTRRRFEYRALGGQDAELNDVSFLQWNVQTSQQLIVSLNRLKLMGMYSYGVASRRYELANSTDTLDFVFEQLLDREKRKDFTRQLNVFELQVEWQVAARHQLRLNASNRYQMFDTPSEANFNDHDELIYGGALEWESDWDERFSTRYKLSGNVRQYAFLFAERSQDNYTQRSLLTGFYFRWNIWKSLRLKGEQLVYVTYNVKDFEDLNRTDRSTRNLESRLELSFTPVPLWQVKLSFYRKATHLSYLNWIDFAETTLDTTRISTLEFQNYWKLKLNGKKIAAQLQLGYKHFNQSRLSNTAMIDLQNALQPINLHLRNLQTGPITGLRFTHKKRSVIEASLWWQIQQQDNQIKLIEQFFAFSSSYREEELRKRKRSLRPFLNLQMNWSF